MSFSRTCQTAGWEEVAEKNVLFTNFPLHFSFANLFFFLHLKKSPLSVDGNGSILLN